MTLDTVRHGVQKKPEGLKPMLYPLVFYSHNTFFPAMFMGLDICTWISILDGPCGWASHGRGRY